MKGIKDILAALPEDVREAAREVLDAAVESAETKGRNAAGFDRRQADKTAKSLEKAEARIAELEQATADADGAAARVKAMERDLQAIADERDALVPFRERFESAKFRDLVAERVRLADDAYMPYLLSTTGAKLVSEVKDGETVYTLDEDGAAALDAWVADPANAHRVVAEAGGRQSHTQIPGYRPTAPAAGGGAPRLSDPVLQAQLESLPPASRERVLRTMQRQSTD